MVLTALEVWKQHVVAYPPITPSHGQLSYKEQKGDIWIDRILNYRELKSNDPHLGPNRTKILKYTVSVFGQQPPTGFPLFIGLHGGGKPEYPTQNDDEWGIMSQSLYKENIEHILGVGVYVAARGIAEEWNLHFRSESYLLFQRLIRNLLHQKPPEADEASNQLNPNVQHFVDPNRIYVLGFSAGGDGIYRLSTVLADRFAATNMSAGHPGGVKFHNLANLPICLQVGEEDGDERAFEEGVGNWKKKREYERNQRTIDSANTLKSLKANNEGSYSYDIFMHPTREKPGWAHNSWEWSDELSDSNNTQVFRNWANFRADRTTMPKNTCAVRWVSKAIRTPLAPFVVWDLDPLAREDQPILPSEWGPHRFFYWLATRQSDVTPSVLSQPKDETDAVNTIRARYGIDASGQWIWIEQTPVPVTVLLNSKMGFDFTKPVTVSFGKGKQLVSQMTLIQYDTVQKATVEARGDPDYIFSATVVVDPVKKTAKDGGSQVFSTTPRARL